jgi:putative flippase GtrA
VRNESQLWWQLPEKLRFLVAGAYNTLFGYVLFAGMFVLLRSQVNYLVIAGLCVPISLTNAFIIHRNLVFRSREPWLRSFLRFNLSQLVAFLFGMAGLYGLVHFVHLTPLLAQALVVAASVALTYVLHRIFSFQHSVDRQSH